MEIKKYIKPLKDFQYSVNIAYDLNNDEKIKGYIPTLGGLEIIEDMIQGTKANSSERARLFVGAYGKGKSHLVLTILSMLYRKDKTLFSNILTKIESLESSRYDCIKQYIESDSKLLPVVIDGTSNNIRQLFLVSLRKALEFAEIECVIPNTYFTAAVEKINEWKAHYKETFDKFESSISISVTDFINALKDYDQARYDEFVTVYPKLTSGSEFLPLRGINVLDTYKDVIKRIKEFGYNGLVIVYDEFSKFLESAAKSTEQSDIKMFQDFAEYCNRSGDNQMHLILITHKHIQNYIGELPKEKIDDWSGVENRYKKIEIYNHNAQVYDIISQVIEKEAKWFNEFKAKNNSKFTDLIDYSKRIKAFNDLKKNDIDKIVYDTYPLFPISTFLLPQISEKVAQNERTIFTFLASNQKNTLSSFLSETSQEFPLVTPDFIYDYFEALFQKDNHKNKTYQFWKLTTDALGRIEEVAENKELINKIIKTLALIYILDKFEKIEPTAETIVGIYQHTIKKDAVLKAIKSLAEAGVLGKTESNGHLWLRPYHGLDLIKEIADTIDRNKSSFSVLQELNDFVSNRFVYPTKHNDERDIVRFFDIKFIPSPECYDNTSFRGSDGTIYLIHNIERLVKVDIVRQIEKIHSPNILFVTTKSKIPVEGILRKYQALKTIENKYEREKEFGSALKYELNILRGDLNQVLDDFVNSYLKPELGEAEYYSSGVLFECKRRSQLTNKLSEICDQIYKNCPIIKNEIINKNGELSGSAKIARNKVLVALLANTLEKNLGFTASGPEMTALRSTLIIPGIMKENSFEVQTNGLSNNIQNVLDIIDSFIKESAGTNKKCFGELFKQICSSQKGIGLKKGLLPIYLAVMLRGERKRKVVLYYRDAEIEINAKNLELLTSSPDNYYIKLEEMNPDQELYINNLAKVFSNYVNESEKEFNSFDYIAKAMQRWFIRLPKYTKESELVYGGGGSYSDIDKKIKKFRNQLKPADINARELLFEKLSSILSKEPGKGLAVAVRGIKESLDLFVNRLISQLSKEIVTSLNGKNSQVSFIDFMKNWSKSISENTKSYMLNANSEELFRIIERAGNDEVDIMMDIARLITGLRIEDWEQAEPSNFVEQFINLIKEIEDKNESKKSANSDNVYEIVSIDHDGKRNVRKLEKTEISSRAKLLKNRMLTQIEEEFGDSIPLNEKRLVLMSILEEMK